MRDLPEKVAALLRSIAAARRPAALLAVALAAVAAGLIWQTASPQVARRDAEGSATQARDVIPEVSHPPFRQLWSFDAEHQIESFVVTEDAVLFGTFQSYGAVSLKTGAVLWEKSFPEEHFGAEVAYDGKALHVAIGDLKLLACEPKTGRELWSVPIGVSESQIAVYGGTVVCETQPGVLAGVDAGTGRQRWAMRLSAEPTTKSGTPDLRLPTTTLISAGRMFLGTFSGEVLCLEPREGVLVWRRAVTTRDAWVSGLAADGERLYCTTEAGELIALNLSDGEPRWRFVAEDGIYQKPAVLGDLVLVGARDGVLYAVDCATGRRRWTAALSRRMEPDTSAPTVHAGQILVTAESTVSAFTNSGKMLWSWDTEGDPLFGYPVTVLNDGLLLADAAGFRRFVMGEPPALPATITGRQTLAQELVGRFDTLNQDERRTLTRLGDEAFPVLLPMARERLQRYEAAASVAGNTGRQARREAYLRYTEAMEVLTKVATKEHTPEMLALVGVAKTEVGWTDILQWLADKGDERQTTPLFLDILEREEPDWDDVHSRASVALGAVSRSRDPRAVRFLIQRLADPEADPQVRHEAYVNLARTGGAAGLEAVLAAKDTRREIPSLEWFLGMDQFTPPLSSGKSTARRRWPAVTRLLALREGEGGISWGLFSSQALGSVEDLWVSERAAGHWSTPIFTDTTQEGLGNADWYGRFVADPALERDSDRDGFSDLVEDRLGTDPDSADTDGDGLIDAQDKSPLAAPRTLGETEQVLSAAFEARFRFLGERDVPCLVELPQGIEPFEFAGWDWIVIPRKAGAKSRLAEVIGKGLAVVSFAAPSYDLTGAAVHGRDRAPFILWNEAHTEAKLEVRTFYGGLDGTGYDIHLKKLAGHWVVTETEMIWIS